MQAKGFGLAANDVLTTPNIHFTFCHGLKDPAANPPS
jgi:hypothetical protein